LRGVVSQHLLTTQKATRVAAREILINTPAVANMIRQNNIAQLVSAMQTGGKDGMVTIDAAIAHLAHEGLIDKETAARRTARHRKV